MTALAFDASGRRLITGSRDGVLKMWNFNNGQMLKKMYKDNKDEVTEILYGEMVWLVHRGEGKATNNYNFRAKTSVSFLSDGIKRLLFSWMILQKMNLSLCG